MHFIVLLVDTAMALPTDIDAHIKLGLGVMFAKMGAAVQLTRNQMMEGERTNALTKWASSLFHAIAHGFRTNAPYNAHAPD